MTTTHYLHVFEAYRDRPNEAMGTVVTAARKRGGSKPKARAA